MAWARACRTNYLKNGDARVIAHTKVVGGGQSDTGHVPDLEAHQGRRVHVLLQLPGPLVDHEGHAQVLA